MEGGHYKVKAREIKRLMLEKYLRAINCYNEEVIHIEASKDSIRNIEADLKKYFGITKRHPLGEIEDDIPF